jgi:hypothetical protein
MVEDSLCCQKALQERQELTASDGRLCMRQHSTIVTGTRFGLFIRRRRIFPILLYLAFSPSHSAVLEELGAVPDGSWVRERAVNPGVLEVPRGGRWVYGPGR